MTEKTLPLVMIADADANVRELVGRFIKEEGYAVNKILRKLAFDSLS